jgi:non-ribosomal peptide synthetase component F
MAHGPDRRVRNIRLLTEAERRKMLGEWNVVESHVPASCLHDLFAARAAATPDAVAAVCEDLQLTYGELNQRANQLAHYLRTLGVGPETTAGLCVERSLELIIGLLAILKAGGAYVPLDPRYPQSRLAFMIADARVNVLLTTERLRDKVGAPDGTRVVCLDSRREAILSESCENPQSGAIPENLAYVIYTSGSTGQPKGVQVAHANVVRLFQATERWFSFNETDVWTLFHSQAFDFSVWELWGALLYGGNSLWCRLA